MKQSDVTKLPDGLHRAEPSLYLCVKGASRSWVYITKKNGKQIRRGLGSAKTVTLAGAKVAASKFRLGMVDPPKPVAKEEKHLFKDVAEEAIETRALVVQFKAGSRSEPRMRQYLRDYCGAILGLDVKNVSRKDVLNCLKPIWFDKPHTASRLRRFIYMVFSYALAKELRTAANPADWEGGLEFLLPKESTIATTESRAAPTFEELKAACAKLREKDGTASRAILFGVLTCTRVSEFLSARMEDIDLKKKCWTLPAEKRKGHHTAPHRVPLSRQALMVVKACGVKEGYLFPGQYGKNAHLSLDTPRLLLNRLLPEAKTMHGVRSTFKDWATENRWDRDLSEKALSHKLGRSDTESAYLRTDLFEQRRPLMQAWADAVLPT